MPVSLYLSCLQIETEQNGEDLQHSYEQLLAQVRQLKEAEPQESQYWALSGIIKSHYASQIGGLTGLTVAKQAREDLQKALSMDPEVFSGIAYAELANLYHQTPNWPFSFGSDKMAEKLFHKAVEINPQSLLSNLYFGRYWYEQHNYLLAKHYLASASSIKSCDDVSFCSSQLLLQANNLLAKTKLKDQ
jgi:tetratricopeptide (TPR) repeat protein